jgi:hypothetical protein
MHTRVAPAIALPPFNAVSTTPRGVLKNLDFVIRRMVFQVFSIVGDSGQIL